MANDEIDSEEIADGLAEMEETDLELEGDEILEDEDGLLEDDEVDDSDEEDDEGDSDGAVVAKRKSGDDDDDEEDMVAPDDVEEDLAEILKDRLASEDTQPEEEDVVEVEDRSSGEEVLQPKRADEVLCNSCFLLVRQGAPSCPVGDDSCPVFVK